MPQDRRRFLGHAVVAAAALLTLGRSGLSVAAGAGASPGFGLRALQGMVGRTFTLAQGGGSAVPLRLAQVVPLKKTTGYADAALAREQCFTLVFQSAQRSALAEGIYEFSSEGLAPFSAFMSPIRGDGVSYQVVFSRI
jgi:uncharacterized protein DUF6916